jgi:hypothetical protein
VGNDRLTAYEKWLLWQVFRSIDSGSVKGFPTTVDEVQKEVIRRDP